MQLHRHNAKSATTSKTRVRTCAAGLAVATAHKSRVGLLRKNVEEAQIPVAPTPLIPLEAAVFAFVSAHHKRDAWVEGVVSAGQVRAVAGLFKAGEANGACLVCILLVSTISLHSCCWCCFFGTFVSPLWFI